MSNLKFTYNRIMIEKSFNLIFNIAIKLSKLIIIKGSTQLVVANVLNLTKFILVGA